jgi:Ca2+-binding RTX toxin-like protein
MLAVVGSVLLVASAGVALAANITCLGGPCVGTEQNDRITGSQVDDEIHALGGRDEVTARGADDPVEGGAGRDDIAGGAGGDFLVARVRPTVSRESLPAASYLMRAPRLMLVSKQLRTCAASKATTI